ncbi:GSCFA domain-containing protein [Sphingomonas sp. VDB2]|uniref:GSCFA domain-containing protein n=1 Tax=Sphingomonas sp. VDB2 TaxID=3228751 RepID=UPI003A7FCCC9
MADRDSHSTCPFRSLPAEAYWRKALVQTPAKDVNPASKPSFRIAQTDAVATAGSCFAQHIARHLVGAGYNYFIPENAHPIVPPDLGKKYNYGTFSARFGNIYTPRQLLQLFHRAYGSFQPAEDVWIEGDRYYDPYRPLIQPQGFPDEASYLADRQEHFAAVRRMVEECNVFVFTLGLTEAWVSRIDGAVFPVCPGCGTGTFDPDRYEFVNFTASETASDLRLALEFIRAKNPDVRFVVTVSPVPLIATAAHRHVLVSTTYSKAALRVAAEEVTAALSDCEYFPSYEIITGAYNRGAYFDDDLREVKPEGVAHVMRCFAETFLDRSAKAASPRKAGKKVRPMSAVLNDIICDEETLIAAE